MANVSEMLDSPGMVQHQAFQAWRAANPEGVFLTLATKTKANLHGAACQHLGSAAWSAESSGRNSLTRDRKVMSNQESSLGPWAATAGIAVHRCHHCVRDDLIAASDEEVEASPAAEDHLEGYAGEKLPAETLSLFDALGRHGFGPKVSTGHAGKTINLFRDGTRFGYVNGTVLRHGVLGYHFAHMGNISNSCADELLLTLVPEFCLRYECGASDLFVHTRGSGEQARTYLIIRSASLALRVALQDAGLPVDESVVLPKIGGTYREGAMTQALLSRRERSGEARVACLEHYGYECQACDGNLKRDYPGLERELIHVHHEDPLGDAVGERDVHPIRDLKPVCPNCHVVIHSRRPHYEINEVRRLLGLSPKDFLPRNAPC